MSIQHDMEDIAGHITDGVQFLNKLLGPESIQGSAAIKSLHVVRIHYNPLSIFSCSHSTAFFAAGVEVGNEANSHVHLGKYINL